MKVFLDECVDWRLAREISGHEVWSARDMKWQGVRNGELLARASNYFDVFVTVDRNLSMQQNVSTHVAANFGQIGSSPA